MKIMHLIRGGDSGGAKTHLFTLLDELQKYVECEVVCLIPGVFYREILDKDIKTTLFPQKNRFDLSVVKKIKNLIEEDGVDILHVHGAMANFIAQFLKKKIDIPIVTTMHSDYLLDFDTFFKKIVFTALNAASLRKIDYFIAVSDNFKSMLMERKFRPNGIYTVYNGMQFANVPKEVTPKEEFAAKYGLKLEKDVVYIGIAARFDAVKGVDIFIEGASKLYEKNKNVRFLIAGDGEMRDQLKELAKSLGIDSAVHFLGFVHDIYGFLNFIDVNCLTSLCESFPYSMLEGAAMKKPMVASNVGGISSLVIEDETGYLFPATDSSAFAEKLQMMCESQKRREEMGERIYERATTLFSAETFAKTHVKIYNNILADFADPKRYDFIISGYYGYNNSGDDALLLAMITELKKQKENVRVAVLSADPKATKKLYKVDSFNRFNPFNVYRSMRKSKVLLSGGGSLIQDETSSKSLWYYATILKVAKKCGLKVMQIANGIGPVSRVKNRKLATNIMNTCVDRITLREEKSLAELEKMNINVNAAVTCDPAMMLEGAPKKDVLKIFDKEGIQDEPYVCISMRDWDRNPPDFEHRIAHVADYIYETYGFNIVFIIMQYPTDLNITKRIMGYMKSPAKLIGHRVGIENMIGIIREAELVLAMRLHTLIYGVSMKTPVIAIQYDPKVDSFMEYLQQKRIVKITDVDVDMLKRFVDECVHNRETDANARLCDEMKKKAKMNIDIALELLEKY